MFAGFELICACVVPVPDFLLKVVLYVVADVVAGLSKYKNDTFPTNGVGL
jgi:hypothetical protein